MLTAELELSMGETLIGAVKPLSNILKKRPTIFLAGALFETIKPIVTSSKTPNRLFDGGAFLRTYYFAILISTF